MVLYTLEVMSNFFYFFPIQSRAILHTHTNRLQQAGGDRPAVLELPGGHHHQSRAHLSLALRSQHAGSASLLNDARTGIDQWAHAGKARNLRKCAVDCSWGNVNQSCQTGSISLLPLDFIAIFSLPSKPSTIHAGPFPKVQHPTVILWFLTTNLWSIEDFWTDTVLSFKGQ